MAKYKFRMHISAISSDVTDTVEFADDITDSELDQELREWVGNEIDCWIEKVKGEDD